MLRDIITAMHDKKLKLIKVLFAAAPSLPPPPTGSQPPPTSPLVHNLHEALLGLAIDSCSGDDEDSKKWDNSLLSSLGPATTREQIFVGILAKKV